MASDKGNVQSFARPTSRPRPPPLSSRVFPPLPPLSPPDADDNSRLRKALPPPPAPKPAAPRSQTWSRDLGVEIANVTGADTATASSGKASIKPPSSTIVEPLPKQQQKHLVPTTSRMMKIQMNQSVDAGADQAVGGYTTERGDADEGALSQLFPSSLEEGPLQFGRTIWSVTPEELSALEAEMVNWKAQTAEPAKKISYAEASKRNLPGFGENFVEFMKTGEDVEQPRRTFKKYYGLPFFIPSGPHQQGLETHEEKEAQPAVGLSPSLRSKPSDMLAHTQNFALSAQTPTFYPRQTSDTSELIQMLKVSLSSKKVAPHMDWWPGDWKCTNCGNHNFSYRDACKRCRIGRQEDAGFVFPPSSSDPST